MVEVKEWRAVVVAALALAAAATFPPQLRPVIQFWARRSLVN